MLVLMPCGGVARSGGFGEVSQSMELAAVPWDGAITEPSVRSVGSGTSAFARYECPSYFGEQGAVGSTAAGMSKSTGEV